MLDAAFLLSVGDVAERFDAEVEDGRALRRCCDAAVSGADRVDKRSGFVEMLQRLACNDAKTIITKLPSRVRP